MAITQIEILTELNNRGYYEQELPPTSPPTTYPPATSPPTTYPPATSPPASPPTSPPVIPPDDGEVGGVWTNKTFWGVLILLGVTIMME